MDEKGFIFTVDASLALIVVIVFAASIATYYYDPIFMGDDHQHLEALADSALSVMEQDGTFQKAAAMSYKGDTTTASTILNNRLNMLIPGNIAYKITMSTPNNVVANGNNPTNFVATDTATKVRILSLPQEGWMGRAWYKIENFTLVNDNENVTTTLWNFHNYITNFDPWGSSSNPRLASYPYWGSATGSPNTPISINFSFPTGSTIQGAQYLVGSTNQSGTSPINSAYSTNLTLNGNVLNAPSNQYTFLYRRPGGVNYPVQNYQSTIPTADLVNGVNSFYLKFLPPVSNYVSNSNQGHTMPWFSIIGNYSTNFLIPQGIYHQKISFPDAAGMAVQTAQDLGDGGSDYGRIYNLQTGAVSSFTTQRVIPWNSFRKQDASNYNGQNYQNGQPFVITGITGQSGTNPTQTGCAVSVTQNVNIPTGNSILDTYTVINPYGGVDCALVEAYNGTTWNTVFCSFDYDGYNFSNGTDPTSSNQKTGYGNIPGIVSIPSQYLTPGQNNKIRVTIWDNVPSNDYDLVGLVNCYSVVSYSSLGVAWINSYFDNFQTDSNTETQTKSFNIGGDAKQVLLFLGTGLDTRHITVKYPGGATLYDSNTVPFNLDLAALDAAGPHQITTSTSTPSNYYLKTGNNYNLTVTVTGPPSTQPWESGDWHSNAEIFSGTRISVLYPQSLVNTWTLAFNDTAAGAMANAKSSLVQQLGLDGTAAAKVQTEALFTGDLPNQIPVRLDLWKT